MHTRPIYLDYAATTPVDPRAAEKMIPYLTQQFGNPASRSHAYGWQAEAAVTEALEQVAALIGADLREIVWTSGATESNNLAIKGVAHFYSGKGKHLITVTTEHKAVLDTMRELEREGFEVTYLDPEPDGLVDLEKFQKALRADTVLASVMFVNKIGVIQDIAALGELCRSRGLIFHVDAAQATGKVAIDLAPFIRAQFDKWFSSKVREAGALLICETTVDSLLLYDLGRVVGVRCDRVGDDVFADVVVLADGVNSLLARKAGFHPEA